MAVREFDGVDDHLAMDGSLGAFPTASAGVTVLLLVKPSTVPPSTDECFSSVGLTATALNGVAALYEATTGALWWGADNPSSDVTSTTAVTPTTGWGILALTKATGTVAPRFHWRALGSGSWSRQSANATVAASNGTANQRWNFGRFTTSSGFRDMRLAAAGLFNRDLSDAEIDGVYSALTTTSIYALGPIVLCEFTQASTATAVTDLMGLASQASLTGTTVITGDDPAGWTFGLGPPGPIQQYYSYKKMRISSYN